VKQFHTKPSHLSSILWVLLLLFLGDVKDIQAQFKFSNTPATEVIRLTERQTPYRFLYRDALIAGVRLTFESDSQNFLQELTHAFAVHGITLRADSIRYQIFLFKGMDTSPLTPVRLSGNVVDGLSGAPLAFATVSWRDASHISGVTTNEQGWFTITNVPEHAVLEIRYLGYETLRVSVSELSGSSQLTVRLQPLTLGFNPIIVTSTRFASLSDSVTHAQAFRMDAMQFGGMQTLRSVSSLPAVHVTGAFSGGIHVRGSHTDAFDVQLDGMSVFGPTHFFGLFDAFNAEVLRAVGFYYDMVLASFSGPPGATISYLTRTGSQRNYGVTAGMSNSAARMTTEGPLFDGNGSWIISGRLGLLNHFPWLGNERLINWGLDVNRRTSLEQLSTKTSLVTPVSSEAQFFDLHAKGLYEFSDGTRLTLSGYMGGNDANADSERIYRAVFQPGGSQPQLDIRPVQTQHSWGNQMVSLQLQHPFMTGAYLSTLVGVSRYYMQFTRDDFLYNRNPSNLSGVQTFIGFFGNENELINIRFHQTLDVQWLRRQHFSIGHTFQQHRIQYAEKNAFDPLFDQTRRAWQWDPFIQTTWKLSPEKSLHTGMRAHYFSDGGYLRLSPRIRLDYQPNRLIQLHTSYSRNYQFLHSLSLTHYVMSEFWVMTTAATKPSTSDQLSAGIRIKPSQNQVFQLDVYSKWKQHGRLPSVNARALVAASEFEFTPWFSNNQSWSRGLELLHSFGISNLLNITNSYTWSITELSNPAILGGERFYPEWDRRHQGVSEISVHASQKTTLQLSLLWGSGAFNTLHQTHPNEPERLSAYFRVDAGLSYTENIGTVDATIRIGIYNMLNRENVIYRTTTFYIETIPRPRISGELVHVYDLGWMPSVDVKIVF